MTLLAEKRTVSILLVDDDEGMRYIMARTLKSAGYAVAEAATGEEALQRVQAQPDLVVLDVRLPDINGFEVCRRIKADAHTLSIPVLQVSAERISAQDQVQGLEGGADAYLTHPIDGAVLNATVKALLRIRETERALAQSQRFSNLITEAIPQMVWSLFGDGRVEYVNRHWINYTGLDLAQLDAQSWLAAVHPDEQTRAHRDWQLAQSERRAFEGEYCFQRVDGAYRWHLVRAIPLQDDAGVVQKWFGTCTDIDAQLRAQNALATEKQRLAVTLHSIADAVITTDREGRIELMNEVAQQLSGWSLAAAYGHRLADILPMADADTHKPAVDAASVTAQDPACADNARLVLRARDGGERTIEQNTAPIRDASGQPCGVVVVLRDVTEKLRWEDAMVKTQKLESLGVLAGGIAHDFNNLLTAILGNISLAKLPGIETQELLTEAEKACLRARGLTYQLLTFAKGGAPVKKIAALAPIVTEAATFAVRGSHVQCEFVIDPDLPPAEVDAGQIGQVINNLVLNAAESMPEGGKVRVALTLAHASAAGAPACVRISVADSGTGIHPKHLVKIFDPYFTTKQKGSGLGLAVVYSVVKKHGGEVQVESELGRGTCFHISLPIATDGDVRPLPAYVPAPGSGRILIMDDEETILLFTHRVLTALGYDVILAREGKTAVRVFEQALNDGTPFIATILDLTVPGGMGGRECLTQLRQRDPGIHAIATSGYFTDPVMCRPDEHGFNGALAKPFLPAELAKVVSEAQLAGRSSA